MKTSIKLLLIFVGITGLLVLASDVVLWAYFKKGVNGDGTVLKYPKKGDNATVQKMIDLRPFKAIVVNSDRINIMPDTKNRIGFLGEHEAPANLYKQVGDTLYILNGDVEDISVYCTTVQYIRLAKDSVKMDIGTLHQPELEVSALDSCEVELTGLDVEKFTYKGGKNNKVLTRELGSFNTINVQLDWYGSVYLEDVTVKDFTIKADSMRALRLDEMALSELGQFKRN